MRVGKVKKARREAGQLLHRVEGISSFYLDTFFAEV
jgi:hypothetical protein